jgi:hypothetical protein
MWDVLRSNDVVVINLAQSVLRDLGIETFVADQHMSVVEGSIGAFPRRLQVPSEHWSRARRALTEAGLQNWLVADGDQE